MLFETSFGAVTVACEGDTLNVTGAVVSPIHIIAFTECRGSKSVEIHLDLLPAYPHVSRPRPHPRQNDTVASLHLHVDLYHGSMHLGRQEQIIRESVAEGAD